MEHPYWTEDSTSTFNNICVVVVGADLMLILKYLIFTWYWQYKHLELNAGAGLRVGHVSFVTHRTQVWCASECGTTKWFAGIPHLFLFHTVTAPYGRNPFCCEEGLSVLLRTQSLQQWLSPTRFPVLQSDQKLVQILFPEILETGTGVRVILVKLVANLAIVSAAAHATGRHTASLILTQITLTTKMSLQTSWQRSLPLEHWQIRWQRKERTLLWAFVVGECLNQRSCV